MALTYKTVYGSFMNGASVDELASRYLYPPLAIEDMIRKHHFNMKKRWRKARKKVLAASDKARAGQIAYSEREARQWADYKEE